MLESVFGVHPTILLELVTIPLFTGVIGYITNWTGVLMLFRPRQLTHRVPPKTP